MTNGTVFNIQRFSLDDGPGIRTTVFLKGCSMRCYWCHNPESLSSEPKVQFYADKCIDCDVHCCTADDGTRIPPDRLPSPELIPCYAGARILCGKKMTAQSVADICLRDRPFYEKSGGGVTFSGGEPLLQPDFVAETAYILRGQGIHIAIETAGFALWKKIKPAVSAADLLLYDIKAASPECHIRGTGISNELIFENLEKILEAGKAVLIRIPFVPGYNDTEMPLIAERLAPYKSRLSGVQIMPYHSLAEGKYRSLGTEPANDIRTPSTEQLEQAAEHFAMRGITTV